MAIELALDPKDQATYGGPEWIAFDITALPDVPFNKLDQLERQLIALWGIGFPRFIAEEMSEETLRAKLALVWLGRKIAGVENTPDLKDFAINAARVRVRAVKPGGDVDPPAQPSSSESSEEEKSVKASSNSSRGSGRNTSSRRAKSGS